MGRKSVYAALSNYSPLVMSVIKGGTTFTERLDDVLNRMEDGEGHGEFLFSRFCADLNTLNSLPLTMEQAKEMAEFYKWHCPTCRKAIRQQGIVNTGGSGAVIALGKYLARDPKLRVPALVVQGVGVLVLGGTGAAQYLYWSGEKKGRKILEERTELLYDAAEALDEEVQELFFAEQQGE